MLARMTFQVHRKQICHLGLTWPLMGSAARMCSKQIKAGTNKELSQLSNKS